MRRLVCFGLALGAALSDPIAGQPVFPDDNGIALQGVREFDAKVQVLGMLNMDEDRPDVERNALSAFELALRHNGIVVTVSAPNYLICTLMLAESNSGLVVYRWGLYYYGHAMTGVYPLLWKNGGLSMVGRRIFSPASAAQKCADTMASEWLRWNPK